MGLWMPKLALRRENTRVVEEVARGEGSAWPERWNRVLREPEALGREPRARHLSPMLAIEHVPATRNTMASCST